MKPQDNAGDLAGTVLEKFKDGEGTSLLGKWFRDRLIAIMNSWTRLRVVINYTDAAGNVIDTVNAKISQTERGSLITLPNMIQPGQVSSSETIIPAQFYNIANTANNADTWKTFQMRDLVFAGRSKYRIDSTYGNFQSRGQELTLGGNGEIKMGIWNDFAGAQGQPFAQPTALSFQGLIDNTAATNIFDLTIASGAGSFGQIVLNDTVSDAGGTINCSFWMEIIDDATQYCAVLKARMFDPSGHAVGRATDAFPAVSENIIPLCIIGAAPGVTPSIRQIQTGNLVNRTPEGSTKYRGSWTPDALVNQVFFPGDQVLDTTASVYTLSGVNFYYIYQMKAGIVPQIETTSPRNNLTRWTALYAVAP